ncbi:hypothetical protein LJC22_04790 [Desulfosarcina sp. OttesenSCG-928-G10]|nr:hypothetical protein [Desulfosarcina sp. OttesenSCG-928-G10]MDL2320807.1 hypothetical protein [Desulfosarcina sp. OttesenSCG-928-B08]
MTKHDIYNKLDGLSEKDLASIADFVDFIRHQQNIKPKKILKLQGILKNHAIDFSDLKSFKIQTWQRVEEKLGDA